MNSTILPVCLPNSYTYEILGNLKIEIVIVNNVYQIPIDALFLMAARKNAKRGFLFVSKVIGKHIPVHPLIPLLGSGALAGRYASVMYQEKTFEEHCDFSVALTTGTAMAATWEYIRQNPLPLPEKTLFIGFAETATALGHGVFSCFAENAKYIHTTRENVLGIADILNFTEEHSHAMEHYCYALEPGLFANEDMVVLIDDEITTGKSALNFIRAIQSRYPRKKYALVSLLDWRSQQDKQRYVEVEKELDINIHTISLLSGEIAITGDPVSNYEGLQDTSYAVNNRAEPTVEMLVINENAGRRQFFSSFNTQGEKNTVPYLHATGRFGITSQEQAGVEDWYQKVGIFLKAKRRGSRTLCLGTGEFMYIPFRIASYMGEGVKVQSTTRSPIYAVDKEHYAVRQFISFSNAEDGFITNYLYNIPPNHYDEIFIFLERAVDRNRLEPLLHALALLGIASIYVVACVGRARSRPVILPPQLMGSYSPDDVVFLLKNIGRSVPELDNQTREALIQGGRHYSEMLPVEYQPTPEYINLFHHMLHKTAAKIALATGAVAEQILKLKGTKLVLVSLARAGTPIGILIKRYIKEKTGITLPHYSISIIRDKGIDENALLYIRQQHPDCQIQFVDGWTGKGAITTQLIQACTIFNEKYGEQIVPDLAVLADPGHCVALYGTREDFLIPSACLNSTVSGLISRTVHMADLIDEGDFHGARFYEEWREQDVSALFITSIVQQFPQIARQAEEIAQKQIENLQTPSWAGLNSIKKLQAAFNLSDPNLIKPGIGETTRVLLRRVPWKILIDDKDNPNLQHILLLAQDRGVAVVEFPGLSYSCCGLIKAMGGD
jgi:orotate phosphoribosyltransferase